MVPHSSVTFQPGEIIFREGSPGLCSYFIESGQVEIFREGGGKETQIDVLGPHEIFGELAIAGHYPRVFSARALTLCELGVLQKEQLNDRLEEADPVVGMILSVFIKNLRRQAEKKMGLKADPAPPAWSAENNLQAIEKFKLENLLRRALKENQMEAFYQPIVDLGPEKVVGFEALLRWRNSQGEMLLPEHFISVCEETNLILPLGRWVVEQALADLGMLIRKAHKSLFVSINVSGRQLHDEGFFEFLEKHRKANNLTPANIKLEITEQVFVKGQTAINWVMKAHSLGYTLALDDFGTGYSSLQYLSELPLDFIKIDRSFIQKFEKDQRSGKIVQAIIHLAQSFSVPTIAEGIEARTTLKALKNLGCEFGQGFYFCKAMPADDTLKFLKQGA